MAEEPERPAITKELFHWWMSRLQVALEVLDEALDRDDGPLATLALGEITHIGGSYRKDGPGGLPDGMLSICVAYLLSQEAQKNAFLEMAGFSDEEVPLETRYRSAAELHGFVWPEAV